MFLFVKQKTAYEMRIRDWSSDVCSSDLGALDAQTREGLQSELVDIHKRTGKTILFVTHDLDEAVRLANRIIVMRSGWVQEIIDIDLPRDRSDLGALRGTAEFAETRYRIWQALHQAPETQH